MVLGHTQPGSEATQGVKGQGLLRVAESMPYLKREGLGLEASNWC